MLTLFPHEILINSISSILSVDGEGISLFRNMVYDSSIVNVFPHSVRSTKSHELKAAFV